MIPLDVLVVEILPRLNSKDFSELFIDTLRKGDLQFVKQLLLPAYCFTRKKTNYVQYIDTIIKECVLNFEFDDIIDVVKEVINDTCLDEKIWSILVLSNDQRYITYFLNDCKYCNDLLSMTLIREQYTEMLTILIEKNYLFPKFYVLLYMLLIRDVRTVQIIMDKIEKDAVTLQELNVEIRRFLNEVSLSTTSKSFYDKVAKNIVFYMAYNLSSKLGFCIDDSYTLWVEETLKRIGTLLDCEYFLYAVMDICDIIDELESS